MKKKLRKLMIGGLALGGLAAVCYATRRKDTFSIVLKENLTEGCLWRYTNEPAGVIRECASDYLHCISDRESGGDYGQHKWTFTPIARGEALLRFQYVRPWASEEPPLVTAVYRVTVDSDHKTSCELVEHSGNFNDYALSVG